jgi:hypothetical protein
MTISRNGEGFLVYSEGEVVRHERIQMERCYELGCGAIALCSTAIIRNTAIWMLDLVVFIVIWTVLEIRLPRAELMSWW